MARRAGKYKISERDAKLFDLDASTISTTGTNLDLGGTLDVTGATTLDSTLLCSGHVTIADAKNIVVNTSTGTKIGTATGQKIAFHNATPVVQAAHIADIANDANGTAIATAVNAILTVLENKGLTATS